MNTVSVQKQHFGAKTLEGLGFWLNVNVFILKHMKFSIVLKEMTGDLQREDKCFIQSLARCWVF